MTKKVTIEADKASVEAELVKFTDNILGLCESSFNKVVWQDHVLYHGPPFDGEFDVNKDVHEDRMIAFEDIPVAEAGSRVDVHDVEDEDD